MEKEIWKDIEGYEGLYQVSSHGRVKSLGVIVFCGKGYNPKQRKGKFLKGYIGTHGYPTVTLSKNSQTKTKTIHRLVANAFVSNPQDKPEVNHIDAIKTNNHYRNLEWVTSSENTIKGLEKGIMNTAKGKQKPNTKLDEEKVKDIKIRLKNGEKQKDVAAIYKVHLNTISEIKHNRNWKYVKI